MYVTESLHSKGWNMVHVMSWALEMPSPAKHIKNAAKTKEEIFVFGSQGFANVMFKLTEIPVWVLEATLHQFLVLLASLGFWGSSFF